MSKKDKHWILGSKSFLDNDKNKYAIGKDSQAGKTFLDALIHNRAITAIRFLIPRYYNAITRKLRPRVYDPLVTVTNDEVIFIMEDLGQWQKGYWELRLSGNCFKRFESFEKGDIFVDFNTNFIKAIKTLKRDTFNSFMIDHTGLTYQDDEGQFQFLPHQDRPTLISLLKTKQKDFSTTPDDIKEFYTSDIWNASIKRSTPFSAFKDDWGSIFDTSNIKGEVYNPFYSLAMTRTPFLTSKIAKVFDKSTIIKYHEDQNEFVIIIPLANELGSIIFNSEGRTSQSWNSMGRF